MSNRHILLFSFRILGLKRNMFFGSNNLIIWALPDPLTDEKLSRMYAFSSLIFGLLCLLALLN